MKKPFFVSFLTLMLLSFFAWNCQKTYTLAPLSAIPYTVTDTPCFDSSGHTCTPTATSTPSNTFTVTQTVTPTNSPTHTATATVTNSPTPTATPTQTGTPTFTGTPTNTRTVTATGTPTNSPSPTATATVTSTTTATWMPTPPFISSGWSTFNDAPNGLAEGNGYIYVAEGDGASISIVQLLNAGNNASVTQWTGYSGINFLYPTGVAVNPTTGSVYVLDQGLEQSGTTNGSAVYEFGNSPAPAGVTTWTGYGGTAFNFPSGIAVDSTGNVYVTDQDNFELEEFSSGGTTLAEWNDNNNSYFYPAAVAVDSSNNLYVVDAGNYVVWKLSSISGTVSSWPILPSSSYDTPFYGVGVDSSGNVFVADYTNNLVEVYSGGNLIGEMTGESGTPFSEPDAVLLYNNDIYVANYENSAGIQIFGPNNY